MPQRAFRGGLVPAGIGAIHNVVMHERGGVDELEDDGEINVAIPDIPGGPTGEQRERGPQPLPITLDRVGDVALDVWIEFPGPAARIRSSTV